MWCHLRALKGQRVFSDWCPLQDVEPREVHVGFGSGLIMMGKSDGEGPIGSPPWIAMCGSDEEGLIGSPPWVAMGESDEEGPGEVTPVDWLDAGQCMLRLAFKTRG